MSHLEELKCKVYAALLNRLTRKREYVYRFEYYDADTPGNTIDESNVIQYEFINQGNSIININGLLLRPHIDPSGVQFSNQIPPSRVLLPIRENEMDVTVYRYKFLATIPDPPPDPPGRIDLLLVIMKVKADIATNKKG